MSNVTDRPPISGISAFEGQLPGKRGEGRRDLSVEYASPGAEPPAGLATVAAVLLVFPPSRDTRLVADLARVFVGLRERHGRRCRAMLLTRRFRPIGAKLRQMGMSAALIDRELAQLEAAVARSVWIADGRPRYGSSGGSAA